MTAATRARDTKKALGTPIPPQQGHPMKSGVTIYKGTMVCLNAGYAAPFTAATGLVSLGIAMETKTNSGADGFAEISVEPGLAMNIANQAGNLVTQAICGTPCYAYDDQTVGATAGGARSAAGIAVRVNPDGTVRVLMGLGINA